jgi:hypothetical protein
MKVKHGKERKPVYFLGAYATTRFRETGPVRGTTATG